MIDKRGNWLWPNITEYKKFEGQLVELLKTSLRYTWTEYLKEQQKLHFSGLYVLFNKSNERVWVGRSVNIAVRINSHRASILKEALKRGDEIIVKIIPCIKGSDTWWMEKVLIKYYDLRYTSLNVQSLICVSPYDDLTQFKREVFDA